MKQYEDVPIPGIGGDEMVLTKEVEKRLLMEHELGEHTFPEPGCPDCYPEDQLVAN